MKDDQYSRHDAGALCNHKIMRLIDDLGMKGYGAYWGLQETLRIIIDYVLFVVETDCLYSLGTLRRMRGYDTKTTRTLHEDALFEVSNSLKMSIDTLPNARKEEKKERREEKKEEEEMLREAWREEDGCRSERCDNPCPALGNGGRLPIPANAPSRPSENAVWSEVLQEWPTRQMTVAFRANAGCIRNKKKLTRREVHHRVTQSPKVRTCQSLALCSNNKFIVCFEKLFFLYFCAVFKIIKETIWEVFSERFRKRAA